MPGTSCRSRPGRRSRKPPPALEGQFWLNSRAEDAKKIATLKENGVEVSAPSPELSAALLEKALPLWDAYKTRVPEAAPIIDAYLTLRN